MSAAMNAGLYHPNCKDGHTTYFPGISTPPNDRFSKKEIQKIKEEYKQDQKRQYAERQEERFQRLAENSLDLENKEKYRLKQEKWKQARVRTQNEKVLNDAKAESSLVKFGQMKYNEDEIWKLIQMYISSVDNGMISPLSGFRNYIEIYQGIDENLVGMTTSDGIEITGQSKHFIERVIGTMSYPQKNRPRSGVTVEEAKAALKNPISIKNRKLIKKEEKVKSILVIELL